MAQIWISEYRGAAFIGGRAFDPSVPAEPAVAVQTIVSSSTTNNFLQFSSGTVLIEISADAAFFGLFGSSTQSTATLIPTATNATRFPANTPVRRGVNPRSKLFVLST